MGGGAAHPHGGTDQVQGKGRRGGDGELILG